MHRFMFSINFIFSHLLFIINQCKMDQAFWKELLYIEHIWPLWNNPIIFNIDRSIGPLWTWPMENQKHHNLNGPSRLKTLVCRDLCWLKFGLANSIQFFLQFCMSEAVVLPIYLPVWPDCVIYCTLGNHSKRLATINLPKSPS